MSEKFNGLQKVKKQWLIKTVLNRANVRWKFNPKLTEDDLIFSYPSTGSIAFHIPDDEGSYDEGTIYHYEIDELLEEYNEEIERLRDELKDEVDELGEEISRIVYIELSDVRSNYDAYREIEDFREWKLLNSNCNSLNIMKRMLKRVYSKIKNEILDMQTNNTNTNTE